MRGVKHRVKQFSMTGWGANQALVIEKPATQARSSRRCGFCMPLLNNYDRNNYIYVCWSIEILIYMIYMHMYAHVYYSMINDSPKALWLSAYISPGAWVPVAEGCTFIQWHVPPGFPSHQSWRITRCPKCRWCVPVSRSSPVVPVVPETWVRMSLHVVDWDDLGTGFG